MPQPLGTAEWATNANFASPGDPWDGDPTKVQPPAGKTAEGWEPTEEPPAEFLNDWQNRAGELLQYLRQIGPQNWDVARNVGGTSQNIHSIGYDQSTGTFIVTGPAPATSTLVSRDGGNLYALPGVTPPAAGIGNGNDIASDGAGNWVIAGQSGDISESGDDGETWTTRAIATAGSSNVVQFDAVSSLWVLGNGTPAEIHTSPDRITWTQRFTNAGVTDVTGIDISAAGRAVATTSAGSFLRSTDMLTWTEVSIPGGDATLALDSVAFSEGSGFWFIVGTTIGPTQEVWSSADGITFAIVPANNLPDDGAISQIETDDGELLVVGFGTSEADIFTSVNRGVTWVQRCGFGANLARGPIDNRPASGVGQTKFVLKFFTGRFWTAEESGDVWNTLALV